MRRGEQRGSALVEGAMVLSLFLALTVTVIDLAHFLYRKHAVMEQARAALRAGATRPMPVEEIASLVVFGRRQPPQGAVRGPQGLTLADVEVKVLDAGTPEQRLRLRVLGGGPQLIAPLLWGGSGVMQLQMTAPLELP